MLVQIQEPKQTVKLHMSTYILFACLLTSFVSNAQFMIFELICAAAVPAMVFENLERRIHAALAQ
jgi:hypothetical protein